MALESSGPYGITSTGVTNSTITIGGVAGGTGLIGGSPYFADQIYGGSRGNPFPVQLDKFTILRGSYSIGSRGKVYSLDEVLTSAKNVKWMKCDDQYCIPKTTWELLNLYMTDDGYSDLTPSEFLDKSLAPKEPQESK